MYLFPRSRRQWRLVAFALLPLTFAVLFLAAGSLNAAPISQAQALQAAYAWLSLSPEAMHKPHGQLAGTVTPVKDAAGDPEFYAVDLKPKGYVVMAADDTVEPVVAFSTTDVFTPAAGAPLYDMLRADLPARIARAHAAHRGTHHKWTMLKAVANVPLKAEATAYAAGGPPTSRISDMRVAPLMHSTWNQTTSWGLPVFNYYTPPYSAGNVNNYYTGCVATMLGQLMRFHQWPQTGVGTASYQITVNRKTQQRSLRGGDGAGGPYQWANMPLNTSQNMPVSQQQAIGALLVDAGVASNMDYESDGSGAFITSTVLTNVFHYANAAFAQASLSTLDVAMQANLDAGLPVGLGISGGGEGHAVVADGYGYNAGTLYHHLNMGWSGSGDTWYNLPTIVAGGYDFDVVNSAVFNIEPTVKGEIISGRVLSTSGSPVSGVVITLTSGSTVLTATTNAEGIYAETGVGSNTHYTITPAASSLSFSPATLSVTTGHSSSNGGVGDKTGLDFTSSVLTGSVKVQIDPSAAAAGAEWRVNGGSWETSGATVTGVPIGTGTLSFHAAKHWATPANQPVTVTLNQTTTVQVNYSPEYSLTAVADNSANGQVLANPAPGDMGSYAPGTVVTLTATASSGYYFGGWLENGSLVSTNPTYTVTVKGAESLVANFPPNSLTAQNSVDYATSNRQDDIINVLGNVNDTGGTPLVLSVTQPATGAVTINPDGTLTFTPNSHFRGNATFSVTVGDGNGGAVTRIVTIANWFVASAGTYAGLSLAPDVTNETSGYLRATVTASGAFSGRLTVAGMSYALAGVFDQSANYQKTVLRKDASPLSVSLHLDAATEITGTVSDGVTASELEANRETFSPHNKASEAGKYTVLLASNNAVPGNGYMLVTVTTSGGVVGTGRLADGTVISTGACLNADGTVPYYSGIYKTGTGAGSVLGTMLFQPAQSVQCSGTYAWFRPASASAYYTTGFAESGAMTGALVHPPAPGAHASSSVLNTIAAGLSGGGLNGTIDENGQLLEDGKVLWTSPGTEHLTLAVGTSGQVTGSFISPSTGKKMVVLGVWLADQQLGGGFFLGPDSAGALSLSAQ